MSAGRADKPPRIKGLVKRCRSFKEDLISRLARNKSISKDENPGMSRRTHASSSEGTSPTPGTSDSSPTAVSHSPQVTLSHRLKEAYLTLQFVESLIRKNCIDLIGGSSNVMLDLMGSLLNDVRKTAVSDSPAYQSVISQIKLVLSEFLVAVDDLLLKKRLDEPHRELCYQKLLETLNNIRGALDRLKGLLQAKENGQNNGGLSSYISSSPQSAIPLKSPSRTIGTDSRTNDPKLVLSPKTSEPQKPPLPPKLKHWVGKSFDMAMDFEPNQFHSRNTGSYHLNEWLENSGSGNCGQRYSSQPQYLNIQAKGQPKKEGKAEKRTDSADNLSRSSKGSTAPQLIDDIGLHNERVRKLRTMSDSFCGGSGGECDSSESLDQIMVHGQEDDGSQTTSRSHCSQSLSLGSSLDNLLLVDSQSQHSGISPNSGNRASTTSSTNNPSVSPHSPAGKSGHGLLAGLCTYDPDHDSDGEVFTVEKDEPPALPKKTRQFVLGPSDLMINGQRRCPSPYDNVDDVQELATWHADAQSRVSIFQQQRQFMSYSESRSTLVGIGPGNGIDMPEDRPPLPPKKKHSITAYVELLHNFDASAHHEHFQNHQSVANHVSAVYQNQFLSGRQRHYPPGTRSTVTLYNPQLPAMPCSGVHSRASYSHATSTSYQHFSSFSSTATYAAATESEEDLLASSDLELPNQYRPMPNPTSSFDSSGGPTSESGTNSTSSLHKAVSHQQPPALPPKMSRMKASLSENEDAASCGASFPNITRSPSKVTSPSHSLPPFAMSSSENGEVLESPRMIDEDNPDLYLLDVSSRLIQNDSSQPAGKGGADGPEVKGGDPHILMVYAASPDLTDLKFWEVFLLTYRTFVRPLDLVTLLWKRFEHFEKKFDRISMIHRRATLELFVDVICSLTPMDMEESMIQKVRNCVYHLVNAGEIHSALKSRKGLLDKYEARIKLLSPKPVPVTLAVTTEHQSLLRWNATSIAQQMTLLDADLFRQLEPAELLLWAREQQEDFCPALNNFTDHFNKVSYWARSKVLLCPTARERNRTMKKMIEVMRKLREYSNFNSLLAVLAALDSAPIRRLGFSRRLTEALKPHAALTDSSGSFRTYRQALAESKSPCIPYIGLVLQDLTFVHIGNADCLTDGKVNWLKRWQQWLVLEPIRRFHACHYGFLRNDSLLSFLNNFDESLNDDDLWQMSESIKPRGKS